MHGHTNIIALRLAGKAPAFVFVNDYHCPTDWFEHGEHATVCTAGDSITAIDFRFLTGLKVSISATSERRAKALFELAKASGATTVAAGYTDPAKRANERQTGWQEVWHLAQKKELEAA